MVLIADFHFLFLYYFMLADFSFDSSRLPSGLERMGVPGFFQSLAKKYPDIAVGACTQNTSNVEFHNLYLDMNGIIHNCTHPEDRYYSIYLI